jgi:4-aminobutyrate aminotransferase
MTFSDLATSITHRDQQLISDALKIRYTPFVIDHGEGACLFDPAGKRYIDFGAAWSAAGLGYSNQRVREAIQQQIEKTTCGILVSGMHEPAVDLAERLIALAPGDFEKKVWFGLAGSDASEAAQRMILRATGKPRIVSFIGSWHGTTDAAMALSAHPSLLSGGGAHVTKIPYPNPYRDPFGGEGERLTDRCLDYLEKYLFPTICPPDQVAAIFVEAVQADGGDVVPPADFLPKLRALCDRHGILLVVDEIKVGLGRTGEWFAFQHGGAAADLILLGKSLGGGLPLSAIVGRREILDVAPGIALFTMVGNATSCAAGIAVLEEIERLGLVARSREAGERMLSGLRSALGGFDAVGDVRGQGMILGVELVEDRETKAPETRLPAKIVYRAWQLGLIVYYAGNWGNVLEFTPPLVITDEEIDEGIAILRQAFEDVLAGAVSDEEIAPFAGW